MTSSTDQQPAQGLFPSAAQIKQRESEIRKQFNEYTKGFNLRIRAIELAAQFKSEDPMKLAREIYKFLSDTET